jgi:hypothetical protein
MRSARPVINFPRARHNYADEVEDHDQGIIIASRPCRYQSRPLFRRTAVSPTRRQSEDDRVVIVVDIMPRLIDPPISGISVVTTLLRFDYDGNVVKLDHRGAVTPAVNPTTTRFDLHDTECDRIAAPRIGRRGDDRRPRSSSRDDERPRLLPSHGCVDDRLIQQVGRSSAPLSCWRGTTKTTTTSNIRLADKSHDGKIVDGRQNCQRKWALFAIFRHRTRHRLDKKARSTSCLRNHLQEYPKAEGHTTQTVEGPYSPALKTELC